MDHLDNLEEGSMQWDLNTILSHQGPLNKNHPSHMGSPHNVEVKWENGETTQEPLNVIAADAPVACAIYAKKKNLLNQPGWRRFKRIAKQQGKVFREANKTKIRQYFKPKFKCGIEVPRDYNHAMELDKNYPDTNPWQEATALEMKHIMDYKVFKDAGKGTPVPDGFKNTRAHLVCDIKHDGRHCARLVADGHLTDIPTESVYSGVVSLRAFRLLIFLGELNGLKLWGTDISSAYLEAKTKEKVTILAGPEFGELHGHRLIVDAALCGLRTSGQRWHDRFSECMRLEGFEPCVAEPDIWMRPNGDVHEYVAVHVCPTRLI